MAFKTPEHFWYGYSVKAPKPLMRMVQDTITVVRNSAHPIPKGGYHLFLLEAYTADKSVLELDLVCEWNGKEHFTCMYRGHNVHYFQMPVVPGHRYVRHITFKDKIVYDLVDMATEAHERFELDVMGSDLVRTWRGVEWHGLVAPFDIIYDADIHYWPMGRPILERDKLRHTYPIEVKAEADSMAIRNKGSDITPIIITILAILLLVKVAE